MPRTEARLTVALGASLGDKDAIRERAERALEQVEGFSEVVVTVEVDEDEESVDQGSLSEEVQVTEEADAE